MNTITYFECAPSAAKEVSGAYPQIDDLHDSKASLSSVQALLEEGKWQPSLEEFPPLDIARNAKITDLMTCIAVSNPYGVVCSPKAKDLLGKFALPQHRWLPVQLFDRKNQIHPYFILNHSMESVALDFQRSVFVDEFSGEVIAIHSLQHHTELRTNAAKIMFLEPQKIVLKASLDWIRLPGDATILVSQRLREAIDAAKLTGFAWKAHALVVEQDGD